MSSTKLLTCLIIVLFSGISWSQCDIFPVALGAYICDDNGTPGDPSDDTFTLEITVDGIDVGPDFNVSGGGNIFSGTYNAPLIIGPYNLADAPFNVALIDINNPNCVYNPLYLDPGPNCDNEPCAVVASFDNYICDDGGTPTDPTDDTFTVDLTVIGINTSGSWTSNGFINDSGPYGTQTYGPFTVYTGVTGIEVVDDLNPNCVGYATLFSPGACSNGCIIDDVFVQSVECSDNGTPGDPSDDVIEITIFPLGDNLGTGYSITTDVGTITGTTGLFDQFEDFEISDFLPADFITVTITADDDPTCTFDFEIEVPDGCGESNCMLTDAGLISFACNDFGTPGIGSDDFIDFIINPTGTDLGTNFLVTSPDGMVSPGFGVYGVDNAQTIMGIGLNPGEFITITITDIDDPNCSIDFQIENITPCETDCEITDVNVSDITCFDNGTSTSDDDTYTFFVNVEGTELGSGWTADDPFNTFGDYNTLEMFGPFDISDGTITITLTDNEDPSCTFTFSVDPPPPCSSGCTIDGAVSNILCDDNGTPGDPNDDVFFFDIVVSGSGTSWNATDINSSSGNHNETISMGPYEIALGDLSFLIFDTDDNTCFAEIDVIVPPTCSDSPCSIFADVPQLFCDDNGTPNDPNDDLFSFEVIVSGTNNGASWTSTDPINPAGLYDVIIVFGPYLITDGTVNFTITDVDDPTCTTVINLDPPPPCSVDPCDIDAIISNIQCDDNGTPNNPNDDTFTFDVDVSGIATGVSWIANDPNGSSGSYNSTITLGPYLIADGGFSFIISDIDDASCTTDVNIDPPPPCSSPGCSISALVGTIQCDDNGTPNDPSDDTFTFELEVNGSNTGTSWTANDPNATAGLYNATTTFGSYLISDGSLSITITDIDDVMCTALIELDPPPPCSAAICDIIITTFNIQCDDNGTSEDPNDDTFTFDVFVTGNNTGTNWIADDPGNTVGNYDVTTTFGSYLITDGEISFTISDIDDSTCGGEISVPPPAPCSTPECTIIASVSNIQCNDNGTPENSDDDTFTFDVEVIGSNTGVNWTANDANNSSGSYNTTIAFGPYLIIDGDLSFTITDVDDGMCTTDINVEAPASCSTPECTIEGTVSNILCDDNGTPDNPDDDTYTFEVTVNGSSTGANWVANDADNSTGNYNSIVTFGPYLIADGDLNFTITDVDDAMCSTDINVEAPTPCSTPECTIEGTVSNILCDDNGTPDDPDDDTYTVEVIVNGMNTGASWTANDPDNSTGNYNNANTFGPYLIIDGDLSFTISDMDDALCTAEINVEAPAPCSTPICSINATISNVLCNDNGTLADSSDDTYTFDILVNGVNTGSNWIATDPDNTSGNYNSSVNFGAYLILSGNTSFTITDSDDITCSTFIDVEPPSSCSNCPDSDTTFTTAISCNSEFVPEEIFLFENQLGCDSIVVVETVYLPLTDQKDTTLCSGDLWLDDVLIQNDTTIVDTIDQDGCDLIITYVISVRTPSEDMLSFELCEGQVVIINGVTFDEENTSGTVVFKDVLGCDSLIQEIEVSYPEFDVDILVSDVICFEESNGMIEISSNNDSPLVLNFNGEEQLIEEFPFSIERLDAGDYGISIFNELGCIKDFEFIIEEGEIVTVDLEGEIIENSSDTIKLQAITSTIPATFNWNTLDIDTTCADCPFILSAFESEFIYGVSVSSELGCSDEDEFSLLVEEGVSVDIPNIFSPNGDNLNDFFTITNQYPNAIRELGLSVYDRWGNLVFQDLDTEEVSWNGRWNDQDLVSGVYVYTLEIQYVEGRADLRKGDVTIIR
ncbi:MAG: gliding motility-associated C-terminal domain-containing protein [Bacteroidota bacterium]